MPSWIWLVPHPSSHPIPTSPDDLAAATSSTSNGNTTANDAAVANSMHVHWAKCQARAERYEEEIALTIEEMGRTLHYFEFKKTWWLSLRSERAESNTPPPADVQRGLHAYAYRQANIYETLVTLFANQWRKLLTSQGLTPDWLAKYPDAADSLPLHPSTKHSSAQVKLATGTTNCKSSDMDCEPHHSSSSTQPHDEDLDAPLMTDVEDVDDNDDNYTFDEAEVFDVED